MKMKILMALWIAIALSSVMLISYSAEAKAQPFNCFQTHLKQAIARNLERFDRYSQLSDGKTEIISNTLILVENLAMPMAIYYDFRARPFQKAGMSIICDELMATDWAPAFEEYAPPGASEPLEFQPVHGKEFSQKLLKVLRNNGPLAVEKLVEEKLRELAQRPSFNCLMHNDLETVRKTSVLLTAQERKAKELGIRSPGKLSNDLLRTTISALPVVDKIDRMAFPLQSKGIAIICQDFPGARAGL